MMETRTFHGETISLLGLGCMRLPKVEGQKEKIDYARAQEIVDYAYSHGVNYFDTAWMYHDGESETFIGQALRKYPRESYNLVTKLPIWEAQAPSDMERIFQTQLERCGVDYFDFYLCHALSAGNFKKMEEFGLYDFLVKKREEGKIRYIGFSFHDSPEVLQTIVDAHQWDFVQIQLNYLDWEMQRAKEQYEILERAKLPTIVMEPVRGGALASPCEGANALFLAAHPDRSIASWAIRFVAGLPNVLTVLSGMSNMEQVQDNVQTMEAFQPLSEEELAVVWSAVDAYKKKDTIPCTGCRYCMDCPFGVDIPRLFALYNQFAVNRDKDAFLAEYRAIEDACGAKKCVACGKCAEHCPQSIPIPEKMKMLCELTQ